jgi:hypothetical protein
MKYALFISYTLAASAGTIGDSSSGTSTAPRK